MQLAQLKTFLTIHSHLKRLEIPLIPTQEPQELYDFLVSQSTLVNLVFLLDSDSYSLVTRRHDIGK